MLGLRGAPSASRIRPEEAKAELQALREQINQIKAEAPYEPPRAMALSDAPIPQLPRVFLRGNAGRPGPEVPRQFLAILSEPGRRPFSVGSGRLELAEAITDNDNPLTARVIVNRVWLHHFGRGIVSTPADFGKLGGARRRSRGPARSRVC